MNGLADTRLRPLLTGLLSYIPGVFNWWDRRRSMGNTASADYCRSIWQFHRDNAGRISGSAMPGAVGELGPGATLGACIAALLDGVDTAVALDAGLYADREANLRILSELDGTSGEASALLATVERAGGPAQDRLRYFAPWNDPNVLAANSLDLIFSQSVLEHVDHPSAIYRACFRWLRPGGLMSHKIDHSSHGITRRWNGHYAVPDWLWKLIYGRRPYLLNRRRPLEHLADLELAGFEILPESSFVVEAAGEQRKVVRADLPTDDCMVRTSTLLLRKPV